MSGLKTVEPVVKQAIVDPVQQRCVSLEKKGHLRTVMLQPLYDFFVVVIKLNPDK